MDDAAIYDVQQYVESGQTERRLIENLMKDIGENEPTDFSLPQTLSL